MVFRSNGTVPFSAPATYPDERKTNNRKNTTVSLQRIMDEFKQMYHRL